ncbi:hypothetical protein D770_05270 [Flammeovirgaceae bacterium 311]|nr:hypothetical protein D770_05270 [Flammeovirgaceae bacterium 311]
MQPLLYSKDVCGKQKIDYCINMLKIINQTIVFLIELIMFGSFAYFGFQKGNGLFEKYGFAIILTLLAIILWAYWAAPKSNNRLTMPYLAMFRLSLFFLASYFLYRCGQTKFAIILTIVSAVTQIASIFLEDNE